MAQSNLKRIAIEQLVPGMHLGADVISSAGLILIPKNTEINDKHIFRLKIYQVMSVVIIEYAHVPLNLSTSEPDIMVEEIIAPIIDEKEQAFSEFKDAYFDKQAEVHDKLNALSNGEPVQLEELLEMSCSLLSSLTTKSELFSYLYHLRAVDDYTYTHSINVSLLCNIFGHWLKLTEEEINHLTIAGLLHDLGKIQVDQNVLNKPGKLTFSEFEHVKKHSRLGYNLIQSQDIPNDIKFGILMHHERMDGSGYPLHLKEDDIHYFAKIIAIVDIYDAMTSERSYHKKFSPFRVIQIFEQESFGALDLKYLFVFLENIAHNYLGQEVKLSTGQRGKVVFIHSTSPSRPIVQVNGEMLDLLSNPSITIDEIL